MGVLDQLDEITQFIEDKEGFKFEINREGLKFLPKSGGLPERIQLNPPNEAEFLSACVSQEGDWMHIFAKVDDDSEHFEHQDANERKFISWGCFPMHVMQSLAAFINDRRAEAEKQG